MSWFRSASVALSSLDSSNWTFKRSISLSLKENNYSTFLETSNPISYLLYSVIFWDFSRIKSYFWTLHKISFIFFGENFSNYHDQTFIYKSVKSLHELCFYFQTCWFFANFTKISDITYLRLSWELKFGKPITIISEELRGDWLTADYWLPGILLPSPFSPPSSM